MNRAYLVYLGDVIETLRKLPDHHFHMAFFSGPYWMLRDYGVPGQMGLEPTWEEFLAKYLEVCELVRLKIRRDATCWIQHGDAFAQTGKGLSHASLDNARQAVERGETTQAFARTKAWSRASGTCQGIGLARKQLMLQPYKLVIALQEADWYVRRDIIWYKTNAAPESAKDRATTAHEYLYQLSPSDLIIDHEYLYQLAPGPMYFYDQDGWRRDTGAKARSVWEIPISAEDSGGHTATFPVEVALRAIRLATSEKGCCSSCGAPWLRQVQETKEYASRRGRGKSWNDDYSEALTKRPRPGNNKRVTAYYETVGWEPSCDCGAGVEPCRVLDPFSGTGTTGVAALQLGRHYTGIELNPEYREFSLARLEAASKTPVVFGLDGVAI